jgi:hypothetical protein
VVVVVVGVVAERRARGVPKVAHRPRVPGGVVPIPRTSVAVR